LGSNTTDRGQLSIQSNNASNAAKATWYYNTTNQGEIGTTGSDFYALAVNNFAFYAGGSERMRITSGGEVGIGTSTMSSGIPLSISAGSGLNTNIAFQQAGTNKWFIRNLDGTDDFSFYSVVNSAERMRITSVGNVGIGTQTPNKSGSSTAFTVNTTTAANYSALELSSGDALSFYINANDANSYIVSYGSRPMIFNTNGNDRMRITSGGDILVRGTYNPYTATNRGNITLNGTGGNILGFTNNSAIQGFLLHDGTNLSLINELNNAITFGTNGLERIRIFGNGNVAIGTGTTVDAGFKLDIGGTLKVAGSLRLPIAIKTATYTLTADDYTVGFDCTSANRTANLPDATTCSGRIYVIYQFGGGSTTGVTIDGNSSQTINGSATYVLQGYCDYSSVMIQSDGSNWVIISDALQTGCL
jgi:hypothetical protein